MAFIIFFFLKKLKKVEKTGIISISIFVTMYSIPYTRVSGIILNQVEPKIIKVVFLAPAWHASEELYGYDSIDVT